MISTLDLRDKEIINISDGKSLGFISDIEINLEKGRVEALIVPIQSGLFSFFSREQEYVVKWKDIRKIGEDVVLVEVKDNINIIDDKNDLIYENNNKEINKED